MDAAAETNWKHKITPDWVDLITNMDICLSISAHTYWVEAEHEDQVLSKYAFAVYESPIPLICCCGVIKRTYFPHYWLVTAGPPKNPDSKVHGANIEPTWGRQNPGGPHVGPINFAIWESSGEVIAMAKKFMPSPSTSLCKFDQPIEFGYLFRWKFGTHTYKIDWNITSHHFSYWL